MSAGVSGASLLRRASGPQPDECSDWRVTSTTITETNLRVLIADENESALRRLHEVLAGLGHEVTPYAVSVQDAVELIAKEDPAGRDRRRPRR